MSLHTQKQSIASTSSVIATWILGINQRHYIPYPSTTRVTHLLRLGCGRWSNFACDLAIIIIHAVNTVRMVDTSNPPADKTAVRRSINLPSATCS